MDGSPKRLVIFASGAGSNAARIIQHFHSGSFARVVAIVCNKEGAGVVNIAKTADIPVIMIERERFFRVDAYLPELQALRPDLIVLAGFLWKIPTALVAAFPQRIINIHPALLPKYGGKGMYGAHVHTAVVEAGEKESGITIHLVDEHYDHGDHLFQVSCPVLPGDSPQDLAARISTLEHAHFPVVIEQWLQKN